MKYFYIHGFGSSPDSSTRALLEQELGEPVVGLTYDYTKPKEFLAELSKQTVANFPGEQFVIFASSLGGYVAQKISTFYPGCIFVLYNPSLLPQYTLKKYGVDVSVLHKYADNPLPDIKPDSVSRVVVLSTDDEVIDYKVADNFFKDRARVVYTKGGHRMTPENAKLLVAEAKFSVNQILP